MIPAGWGRGQAEAAFREFSYSSAEPACTQQYLEPMVDRWLSGLPTGSRLLDLGCGNGAMLGSFSGRGWELVGVDASRSGIEMARSRWPGIRFEQADVTAELRDLGEFDAILSTEVVEHVYAPRCLAANCHRLLRRGGLLVMSTPYHGWLKCVLIALLGKTDSHFNPLWDHGHIKFWSESTLGTLLREAGFDDLEFSGTGRVPHLWKSMVVKGRRI